VSRLWTPPKVDRELKESSRSYAASVEKMVDRFKSVLEDFNRDLKRMDPNLELVFFPPNAKAAGVIPGRYHLMRTLPDGPPSLVPITGPSGEFAEPDSGIFEWLRKSDMWSAAARRDRERANDEARKASERRKEQEAEERTAEIVERWKAATRTFVSMDRSNPWTQNASPAARRDSRSRRKAA
jgi:hypothetical protein